MTDAWQRPEPEAVEETLPYRLEIRDRSGGAPLRVVARAATPAVAYAVYYAAMREFFGETVSLIRDERVVMSSGRGG